MTLKWALACGLLASFSLGAGVDEVRSVYLLPMTGGLEQFLANRLTGVFRVVTDPKLADAVFTDQLGVSFEEKLATLYPDSDAAKAAKAEKDLDKGAMPKQPTSTFGRGKGTIFLVDLKSRAVIWSAYQKRNGSAPETMDKLAGQIAQQLKKQQNAK